jgi:hypothetical protein
MTKLKLLSAALITTAMLAAPAMARESGVASRQLVSDAYASTTPDARYPGHGCIRAPRVGAFASQPYVNPPCEPNTEY